MELDDLKIAWHSLDRRLELHNALALDQFREAKARRARFGLRPLYWGQIVQMVFGAVLILWAAAFWAGHLTVPHLFAAGVVMHAYGIVAVAFGARTLWLIIRVDYSATVLTIQRQLAELRRFYVIGGLAVGLVWWVLWVPMLMVVFGSLGADLFVHMQAWVYGSLAVGVAGLSLSIWAIRWSQRPARPRLARFVNDALTGRSLQRAQHAVDEIRAFERE